MLNLLKDVIGYLLVKNDQIRKNRQNDILSILFHAPSRDLFEKIVKWLIKHNYRIISLNDFETIIKAKLLKGKIAIITFDDGWKSNLELIETVEKYKIPITIFIPTDPVINGNYWFEFARIKGQEKLTEVKNIKDFKNLKTSDLNEKIKILKRAYKINRSCLTLDELKNLSNHKYVTIGSHTVTHPILNMCSIELQEFELSQSKITLDKWLKKDTLYLAYPNGSYNELTLSIAHKNNYKLGFTIHPAKIDVENVDPFEIPRCCINESGGYYENIAKVLGIWQKYFPKKAYLQK